jgi:hypothetical protein
MFIRVSIHEFTACIVLIVVLSDLWVFFKFLRIGSLCKGGVVSETIIVKFRYKRFIIMKRVLILILIGLFIWHGFLTVSVNHRIMIEIIVIVVMVLDN